LKKKPCLSAQKSFPVSEVNSLRRRETSKLTFSLLFAVEECKALGELLIEVLGVVVKYDFSTSYINTVILPEAYISRVWNGIIMYAYC